uniref:Uncharacterized protein n=1 Tax=Cyclopterus lumpus TaxID=8103 RepID=A0A8C3B194_CYCLU
WPFVKGFCCLPYTVCSQAERFLLFFGVVGLFWKIQSLFTVLFFPCTFNPEATTIVSVLYTL